MRVALHDAAPLYRDAPEAKGARASGERTMQAFIQEVRPKASKSARTLAADLIATTLSTAGKRFSESPRARAEIDAYAEAIPDMFCAYLKGIHESASRRRSSARCAGGGTRRHPTGKDGHGEHGAFQSQGSVDYE